MGSAEVAGAFTLLNEGSARYVIVRPLASAPIARGSPDGAAHQRGQQVRRSGVDGTQTVGFRATAFFLHIAIRVGWFRLLPPPRLLRRGLVGLWLVAAASVKLLLAGALLFC